MFVRFLVAPTLFNSYCVFSNYDWCRKTSSDLRCIISGTNRFQNKITDLPQVNSIASSHKTIFSPCGVRTDSGEWQKIYSESSVLTKILLIRKTEINLTWKIILPNIYKRNVNIHIKRNLQHIKPHRTFQFLLSKNKVFIIIKLLLTWGFVSGFRFFTIGSCPSLCTPYHKNTN